MGEIVIHVESPDVHFFANPPRGYKPNVKSVHRAESLFNKAAAQSGQVSVTLEGVFVTERPDTRMPPRHKGYFASIVIAAIYDAKQF
jgi:hypothetical protein